MGNTKSLKKGTFILLIIVAVIVVAFLIVNAIATILGNNKILPGISVAGVDLSKVEFDDAANHLREELKEIKISAGSDHFTATPEELGIIYDYDKSVEEACDYGNKNFFSTPEKSTVITSPLCSVIIPFP